MQLALARSFLGPIDDTMPTREEAGGVKVSKGTLTILMFLFAQTLAAVWWAGSTNEKLNNVNVNMAAQAATAKDARLEDRKTVTDAMELLKKELNNQQESIEQLKTYNQQLREKLAAKRVLN